jgi:hypothetical protein
LGKPAASDMTDIRQEKDGDKFNRGDKIKVLEKETVDGNGVSTFRVQEKILWWWANAMQWHSKSAAENYIRFLQTKEVKYHTVEQ